MERVRKVLIRVCLNASECQVGKSRTRCSPLANNEYGIGGMCQAEPVGFVRKRLGMGWYIRCVRDLREKKGKMEWPAKRRLLQPGTHSSSPPAHTETAILRRKTGTVGQHKQPVIGRFPRQTLPNHLLAPLSSPTNGEDGNLGSARAGTWVWLRFSRVVYPSYFSACIAQVLGGCSPCLLWPLR